YVQNSYNVIIEKPPSTVLVRKRLFDAVCNFGIGDPSLIKGLNQIICDLFDNADSRTNAEG
ncbi:MAG: hypothetical protein AAGA30_13550, partial [Planctomycetota bacterium]